MDASAETLPNRRTTSPLMGRRKTLQKSRRKAPTSLAFFRHRDNQPMPAPEKQDDSQLHLFDVDQTAEHTAQVEPEPHEPPKRRRRKKKAEKLPEPLRREIIEADVSQDQRLCGRHKRACGKFAEHAVRHVGERRDAVGTVVGADEITSHLRAGE